MINLATRGILQERQEVKVLNIEIIIKKDEKNIDIEKQEYNIVVERCDD